MITLCIYTPSYCPKTEKDEIFQHQKQRDCLWQAAQHLIVQDNHCEIELCYVAKSHRTIQPFIVAHLPDGIRLTESERQEIIDSFERLLPDDYGWQRLTEEQYEGMMPRFTNVAYSATLWRRFDFFDIDPRKWIPGTPSEMWGKTKQTDAATAIDFYEQFVLYDPKWHGKKELPPDTVGLIRQIRENKRVCIPYVHSLSTTTGGLDGLFSEMLYASPAMVCIQLSQHGTCVENIDKISQTASFALSCLAPLHSLTDIYSTAELNEIEDFYKSYRHSKQMLNQYSIRIITQTKAQTKSLALCFAAQFGGSRVFDISKPLPIGETKPSVSDFSTSDSGRDTKGNDSGRETFPKEFTENNIETNLLHANNRWLPIIENAPHIVAANEAVILFRLPIGTEQGLPGMDVRQVPPFASHLPRDKKRSEKTMLLRLGQMKISKIENNNTVEDFHYIPMSDLCRHALYVGSTGSGKTTAVQYLLRQVAGAEIPFLVVEPSMKVEYFNKLKTDIPSLRRITLDKEDRKNDTYQLIFDPFRMIQGIGVHQHVSYLKSCFQAAFPLSEFHSMCLETMLISFYEDVKKSGNSPSFGLFKEQLEVLIKKIFTKMDSSKIKDEDNIIDMFTRRFQNLALSPLGRCFASAEAYRVEKKKEFDVRTYLKEPAVLELSKIQDREQQALVMAFFLTFIMETRQVEGVCEGRNKPKHVLVLEEAHRLLTRGHVVRSTEVSGESASMKAAGMFSNLLAEIRSFGQSIVIVEQIPSKLILDAVKNTNLKFLMRLNTGDDREFMGQAMNCSEPQKRFVNTLKTGQAVVFEEGLDQPILLQIPDPEKEAK